MIKIMPAEKSHIRSLRRRFFFFHKISRRHSRIGPEYFAELELIVKAGLLRNIFDFYLLSRLRKEAFCMEKPDSGNTAFESLIPVFFQDYIKICGG